MKNRWIFTAILALTLCALCFSLMPTTAQAALMKTGTCGSEGDNLTWTLDDAGVLTISGTGDMADYDEGDGRWFVYWESITSVIIEEGVTNIGRLAFSGCVNLTAVTIPQTVTVIDDYAFTGCTSLTDITIPDSVVEIGRNTFQDCTSLTSITLPNGFTNLREFTFAGCTGLISIVIPDSVCNIGECAFNGCTGLLSVTVPQSIIRIGLQAFHGCNRLWHVFYKGNEQDWAKIGIKAEQNEFHWAGRHYNCSGQETVDPETNTCSICVSRCEHNWNSGVVTQHPTATEEGILTYTCIDCNATKTEPIEKSDQVSSDPEVPTDPSSSAPTAPICENEEKGGIIAWWWLPIVAGACLVINTVFTIILFKKKK